MVLFDNLPSWKMYPKRSESVVCSTSIDGIYGRAGGMYYVWPKKGSTIGVCPERDIWFSFDLGEYPNLDAFTERMYDYFRDIDLNTALQSTKKSNVTYEMLLKFDVMKKDTKIDDDYWQDNEKLITGYFNRALSPEHNGFKLVKAGDTFNSGGYEGREVWTDGECLLELLNE